MGIFFMTELSGKNVYRKMTLVDKAHLFLQCDFYSWENSRDDAVIPLINGRGTLADAKTVAAMRIESGM